MRRDTGRSEMFRPVSLFCALPMLTWIERFYGMDMAELDTASRLPPSARCARPFPARRGKLSAVVTSLPRAARGAVNVSQSHIAVARVLGTFSHTTCYPISFVLWTCFLDRSARGTAQAVEGAQNRGCCIFVQQPLLCAPSTACAVPLTDLSKKQVHRTKLIG